MLFAASDPQIDFIKSAEYNRLKIKGNNLDKIILLIILLAIIMAGTFIVYYLKKHKYITDKQLGILTITSGIVAIVAMAIAYFTELLPKAQINHSFLGFIAAPVAILILIIATFSQIKKLRK